MIASINLSQTTSIIALREETAQKRSGWRPCALNALNASARASDKFCSAFNEERLPAVVQLLRLLPFTPFFGTFHLHTIYLGQTERRKVVSWRDKLGVLDEQQQFVVVQPDILNLMQIV